MRVLTFPLMAAALVVAGCADPSTRYAGSMATQQGNCGVGFDAKGAAPASLIVRDGDVQFAPADGVTVLHGHLTDAGHFVAENTAPGADRKPFAQVFEGDRAGDQVTGRFATPRCRATVSLTRR